MYNNEGWGYYDDNGNYVDEIYQYRSFKTWSRTHVRPVGAKDPEGGAQGIRDTITSITNRRPGVDIHLLGHSMGGAAIAEYMLDAADGVGADSRVKSAVMIDAPLVESINVGPLSQRLFGSRIKNLGAAAAKLGIKAISVDTPNDWVSSPAIHGVPEVANPTYPKGHGLAMPNHANADRTELPFSEAQNAWHDHTSRYMATETQAFVAVAWR